MKPIIGICVDYVPDPESNRTGGGKLALNWNYAQVVADAGGVPLLLPPQAEPSEVLPLIDGLLIPGGNDIDASHWGEQNHPEVKPIAEERFDAEKRLFEAAKPEMPILGICYGCQFINVMRGGSLIQHIPDIPGSDVHTGGTVQSYGLEPSSHLAGAVGSDCASGESWHHQAIGKVGSGLRVVAKNADDTVEAVEASDRPWTIGVQWHPERTPDNPATRRLLEDFVRAAARYRENKLTTQSPNETVR